MNNNFIPTKKKKARYHFVTRKEPDHYENDADDYTFYYQICTFPNPRTNRFDMRKFIINKNNEFVAVKEFNLTKKQCKKFYNYKKTHQFRNYPVYTLNDIDYPSISDILTAKSDILRNNYDYTGYAPF